MGHKVKPIGLRLQVNRTWDSRWFAEGAEYGRLLLEDVKIRNFVKKVPVLLAVGVPPAVPGAVDLKAKPDRIDFMTHQACSCSRTLIVIWLNGFMMRP